MDVDPDLHLLSQVVAEVVVSIEQASSNCAAPLLLMPTLPQSQSNRRAAETRFVISNPWTSCLLPLALILSLLSLLSPYHPVLPLSTPRLFSILIKAKHFKVMKVMKPPACHCLPSTVHFLITGEVDWCIQLRPSKFSRHTLCTH